MVGPLSARRKQSVGISAKRLPRRDFVMSTSSPPQRTYLLKSTTSVSITYLVLHMRRHTAVRGKYMRFQYANSIMCGNSIMYLNSSETTEL